MATETGENRYKKYGQPILDFQFSGPKGSIRNRADGGNTGVEFTRTQDTQSTYVKSDGTIGYASTDVARFDHDPVTGESLGLLMEESRTNYFEDSSYFNQDFWSVFGSNVDTQIIPNSAVAPDGTFTATKLVSGTGISSTSAIQTTNTVYGIAGEGRMQVSVFVKPAGYNFIAITGGNGSSQTIFDLSSLTSTNSGGAPVPETGTIESYSNGWYRCTFKPYRYSSASLYTIYVTDNSSSTSFTGDGNSGIYIWGAQIEEKISFPTSYIPTTPTFTSRASEATFYNENGIVSTASTDVARDDAYFPDENGNFISAGLLLEEERDNILLHSKDFSSTWDGSTNGTLTLNATTSPDGTNNAALFQNDGLDNSFLGKGLFQTFTGIGYTTPMVGSVYVKNNDASLFTFGLGSLNNRAASLQFDFSTETVTSLSDGGRGSTMSSKVDKLPNDWYRLSFSLTTVDIGVSRIVLNADTGNDTTSVYVWGAQLEVNNDEVGNLNFVEQSTSYIPTTSGISTRAADISSSSTSTRGTDLAQITGSNFSSLFPSVGSGSVFVEGGVIGEKLNTTLGSFASFGTNVNDNFLYFLAYDNRDNVGFVQPAGGNISKYHDLTGKTFKGATAWTDLADASSTGSSALDGDLYGGGQWGYAGVQNPANYDRFGIGRGIRSSTTYNTINGHIKRLTYWPTRLSDSDLQRLTE